MARSPYTLAAPIRYHGAIPGTVRIQKDVGNIERLYASQETQPADQARWKEPPHVALANLRVDLRAAERFSRIYGVLAEYPVGDPPMLDVARIQGLQGLLQRAWRGQTEELDEIELDNLALETELSITSAHIELRVNDLWTLIRILFLRDSAAGRAKACANPNCPAPYFVRARRNQKYCSESCAAPSQREFKRKWWAEHGAEWRANRLQEKPKSKTDGKSSRRKQR